MADRVLFISWGQVVRGREERAIEAFNDSMGFYGRMQQEGRIESFDVALLEPHSGDLGGYIAVHGSTAQLAALRADEEFRRLQIEVGMIIDGQRVVEGYTGEGVASEMTLYSEAAGKVPQAH